VVVVERIVVGTDLSQRSSAAVTMAADLAGQLGATLHLVSACPMPAVGMGPEMVIVPDHGEVVDSTKADLKQLADDLRAKGLAVEIHTPVGEAADALCAVAETVEADLIVVGNKRMHGAARLLGSVPNRVAHKATCSVLIARTA
jgi:nucleotide-binding universal stress UspA family protein